MRIGMFDSGLGGVSVLKAFKKKYPNNEYIYYGDTLNVPYGNKTKEELLKLSSDIIDFLISKNVDMIVIACGTVSSNVADALKEKYNVPIYTVLDFIKNQIDGETSCAVIATQATINSHVFKKMNSFIDEIACPKLVPLIENRESTIDVLPEYITKEYKKIVLGCTHYALIKDDIKALYPNTELIDMGEVLVDNITIKDSNPLLELYFTKNNEENVIKALKILK